MFVVIFTAIIIYVTIALQLLNESNNITIAQASTVHSNESQFWGLYGIAIHSSFIYLTDSGNNRIQEFDTNGNFIKKWGSLGNGNGQFRSPEGIATDASGNVYVVESSNNRIQKFDRDGNFIKKWGSFCDIYSHMGCKVTSNASLDLGEGQFVNPQGIATDASGNVYVVDSVNNRIQKFDSNGNFIKKWGSGCLIRFGLGCKDPDGPGPLSLGDGQFFYPYAIAISSNHDFVTDNFNNRVEEFDTDGNFIKKWGDGAQRLQSQSTTSTGSTNRAAQFGAFQQPIITLTPSLPQPQIQPHPQASNNWHFIVAGDWGSTQETNQTVKNISAKIKNFKFIIGLGDYSYFKTGGYTPTQKWWDEIMKPFEGKLRLTIGDHDTSDNELYKVLSGQNNWYYSFDNDSIHFISIDTQEPLGIGTAQYNFIISDLSKAQKDSSIKWIIVFLHKPPYTAKGPIASTSGRIGTDYSEIYIASII